MKWPCEDSSEDDDECLCLVYNQFIIVMFASTPRFVFLAETSDVFFLVQLSKYQAVLGFKSLDDIGSTSLPESCLLRAAARSDCINDSLNVVLISISCPIHQLVILFLTARCFVKILFNWLYLFFVNMIFHCVIRWDVYGTNKKCLLILIAKNPQNTKVFDHNNTNELFPRSIRQRASALFCE